MGDGENNYLDLLKGYFGTSSHSTEAISLLRNKALQNCMFLY